MRVPIGSVIVTGATSGIGLETARRLSATVSALVIQGPEPEDAARGLIDELSRRTRVSYVPADFTRLEDVAAAADRMSSAAGPIDALVNNAGIPGSPVRRVTPDGHERTLQVNYLAMVLLTQRLRAALAPDARVVNLGSATHEMTALDLEDIELERGYAAVRAYARSKLAIIMYTRWLARSGGDATTAVSLSPGVISTDLLHSMFGAVGGSTEHGARNVLAALLSPATGGEYYDDGRLVPPSAEARDDALADRLMTWTLRELADWLPSA